MPYPIPEPAFDSTDHARNKLMRANQFQDLVLAQYKASYEDFWGVNTAGGCKYTREQMQAILDAMGASLLDVLTDAAGFSTYLTTAYPGMLDEKYCQTAWVYTLDQNGLTVTELREGWREQ